MSGRRARPGATDRAAEDALLAELAAILAEVDARFAGWTCDASTTCCRFGLTGREPYVTGVELLAVRRAVARSGRKLDLASPRSGDASRSAARTGPSGRARGRRALPVADEVDERRCPLLGADGRCTIYASRPFGCRTFFCERAIPADPVTQRDINAFVARIKAVAVKLGPGSDEGRPLVRALASSG